MERSFAGFVLRTNLVPQLKSEMWVTRPIRHRSNLLTFYRHPQVAGLRLGRIRFVMIFWVGERIEFSRILSY